MFKSYSILFILLICGLSCTQGSKHAESKIIVSLAGLTAGLQFDGGGALQLVDLITKEVKTFELTTTNVVSLPHGTWDIFFVGFLGSTAWSGPHQCGVIKNVLLSKIAETVNITVNAANCASAEYLAIINTQSPVGLWDVGNWDQAKWAP